MLDWLDMRFSHQTGTVDFAAYFQTYFRTFDLHDQMSRQNAREGHVTGQERWNTARMEVYSILHVPVYS